MVALRQVTITRRKPCRCRLVSWMLVALAFSADGSPLPSSLESGTGRADASMAIDELEVGEISWARAVHQGHAAPDELNQQHSGVLECLEPSVSTKSS